MVLLNEAFKQRVKELVNDPVFARPISDLTKDHSKRGTIILVTKIKQSYAKK